ncbi:serine threonine-protein kinase smg1 [Hordeum vulgare]|nr:serine threonine-protein kinase smg1 [Hordeum vulgare]
MRGTSPPLLYRVLKKFMGTRGLEIEHPECLLQALSTATSDHCSLHLAMKDRAHVKRRLWFERFWINIDGFLDVVTEAWICDDGISDPFLRLDTLLRNLAKELANWGQKRVGNIKLQIAIANLVILRFDCAMESRLLTVGERWIRRTLKHLVLGLASLERTIARQRSQITWLNEGDANIKLFHLVVNGRRMKNYVPLINMEGQIIIDLRG